MRKKQESKNAPPVGEGKRKVWVKNDGEVVASGDVRACGGEGGKMTDGWLRGKDKVDEGWAETSGRLRTAR